MDILINLSLSLAVGLLIGLERGWKEREAGEGSRIAGIRTFGLIGLLGGLWALLGTATNYVLLGFAFLALSIVLISAYRQSLDEQRDKQRDVSRDYGITSLVAALIAFALGALAVSGYRHVAAAAAVATTILLSLKPVLHHWLTRLESKELNAALKMLLISVVLLPVLPNEGYGPWQALNPYEIWWMVVLIASITFVGYFLIKLRGARQGLLLSGMLGGLASSTAVTLHFSRLSKHLNTHRILAASILIASATMFPRIALEVAVVYPDLLMKLTAPLLLMMTAVLINVFVLWRRQPANQEARDLQLPKPFELVPALGFGALLMAVMLLAEAFRHWFGDTGIYALSAISGFADVDAITLSLARMARDGFSNEIAVHAIILAAMINNIVKTVMVVVIAGGVMARYAVVALTCLLAAGGLGIYLV